MQRTLGRQFIFALAVVAIGALLGPGAPRAAAQDQDPDEHLLKAMRELAEQTHVRIKAPQEQRPAEMPVELAPKPAFRYSDQPRRIVDATLWVYTDGVRPVAMQKVEAVTSGGGPGWTVCFASFSPELLEVRWPMDRSFVCEQPGLEYKSLAEPPAIEAAALRRLHLRQVARRFSASIVHDPKRDVVEQMRLLPRPIYEYESDEAGLLAGAVFGFASNGTNPDAYLVLEALADETGGIDWRYGLVRMTSGGVSVRLDDAEVWSCEWVLPAPLPRKNWMFFRLPRAA